MASLTRLLQRRRMKMQREAFVSWRSYFTPLIRGWGRQLMKVSCAAATALCARCEVMSA
jgi:hypothetical protein